MSVKTARWSLVTGSVILECKSICQKCVGCQDRWSHGQMAVRGLSREVTLYKPVEYTLHCQLVNTGQLLVNVMLN